MTVTRRERPENRFMRIRRGDCGSVWLGLPDHTIGQPGVCPVP
jgi:hypothetical protein